MIDTAMLARARALGSATMHEAAGRIGALPSAIGPVDPGWSIAGPAFTVSCPTGDNLWIHRAIYAAAPGDVLVVATGDAEARWGYWGEILSEAALARRLTALVLQGGSRDHAALVEVGFPVFSLGRCIEGTTKDDSCGAGQLEGPLTLGRQTVHAGDLVVGDIDGVVVIPLDDVPSAVANGEAREAKERATIEQLRNGATTLDLYDLR